ncbi:hypothetical protein HPB52_000918 [Rhipicephalus sanguineus]|uniref:Uncharacterized protein n=1 Tax=Rhipicephalus sanguineus TaxID=34632 RepID=A0A9D4PTF8_RHISA|nr:hypothetical protein HPB52_000918 [Rhipicephalus sanguineus]
MLASGLLVICFGKGIHLSGRMGPKAEGGGGAMLTAEFGGAPAVADDAPVRSFEWESGGGCCGCGEEVGAQIPVLKQARALGEGDRDGEEVRGVLCSQEEDDVGEEESVLVQDGVGRPWCQGNGGGGLLGCGCGRLHRVFRGGGLDFWCLTPARGQEFPEPSYTGPRSWGAGR